MLIETLLCVITLLLAIIRERAVLDEKKEGRKKRNTPDKIKLPALWTNHQKNIGDTHTVIIKMRLILLIAILKDHNSVFASFSHLTTNSVR